MTSTILLVDDHILFREGLKAIIEQWEDFEVIGEASNGLEALELSREHLPDVILMDISMPVMDGLEASSKIAVEMPSTRIVMLTVSEEEENLFKAIQSSAVGYVLKNMPSRRLRSYLQGVLHGEAPISGVMALKILEEFKTRRGHEVEEAPLSDREQEVLYLVAEGLTNQEIAEKLFLSNNTVKSTS